MKISIDISYYPLNESYKTPIKAFIASLQGHEGIEVRTNTMSTQVFGDYDEVMDLLRTKMKAAMDLPHSVFILKVINADLA